MTHIRPLAYVLVTTLAITLTAGPGRPSPDNAEPKGSQGIAAAQAPVEYSSAKSASNRPFSEVVKAGNMLYLSGKLGTDRSGKLAPGGIAAETRQALENIKNVLENNHSSLDHVVKCTVMLADMKEWAEMNSAYATFFKKDRMPARSAFGTSGLALSARVEIECIAVVK